LRWVGHVARKEENEVAPKILFRDMTRTKRQGRPKQRWLDCVEADMRLLNMKNWKALAQN
jgi:hypothetical protein